VLDNEARGGERVMREIGGFVLAPTRGFTRLVTGNAKRVYANPEHPSDHIPDRLESLISVGGRGGSSWREARGGRLDGDVPSHGFMNIKLVAGDLATLDRQKPFDYVDVTTQINFIKGRGLGQLSIEGNLWHWPLTESERTVSKLVVIQDFEYENNIAFEQGGQGVSFMYFVERAATARTKVSGHVAATWLIMGGVQSELAFLAEVEGVRERFREYDFGLGPGFRAGYELSRDGRRVLEGSYRLQSLHTLNGSNRGGFGSDHVVQVLRVRGLLPFTYRGFTAGVDYEFFHRRSDFEIGDVGVVSQRAQQWQAFVTWNPLRDRG